MWERDFRNRTSSVKIASEQDESPMGILSHPQPWLTGMPRVSHSGRRNRAPYFVYRHMAGCFRLPLTKVRIIQPFIGGGFGGTKNDSLAGDYCAVLLSEDHGKAGEVHLHDGRGVDDESAQAQYDCPH